MSDKTAVLLLQMGGPDSLDAVKPFLLNLFSDRDIIRLGPAFLQPFLARRISGKRAPAVERQYEKIGGKSPIREMTEAQAKALEEKLGNDFRCFTAMRYWRPSTLEALAAVKREGIDRIIALSLYPHYSRATTGSSTNELNRVLHEAGSRFKTSYIESYYNHPLYIGALAEKIAEGLALFPEPKDVQLIFSAHSLPESFIAAGDPYLSHIQETVRLVMELLGGVAYRLAFQSRAGPVKWLEPDTQDVIKEMAAKGCGSMLMVPLSFVSDHLETLYEIDIEYRELAQSLGIANFHRAPSLNCSALFIECLAELVRGKVLAEPPG
jgi:protoporphyrin/coproporphyrin ferrochelatase